jgi:hypothetical protein
MKIKFLVSAWRHAILYAASLVEINGSGFSAVVKNYNTFAVKI